jgi:hypothetical protein
MKNQARSETGSPIHSIGGALRLLEAPLFKSLNGSHWSSFGTNSGKKTSMSKSAPSIPASARTTFRLVLLALVGGLVTMWLTRDTNVSADAVASVAAAVIGVAGVHIGHVTAHQFGKEPAGRMHRKDRFGLVVMSVTAMLGLVAIVSVGYIQGIISVEAIATFAAAVIGVVGTHVGHVTGHRLGKSQT